MPKKSIFGRKPIEEIAAMNKVFQKIIEKSDKRKHMRRTARQEPK